MTGGETEANEGKETASGSRIVDKLGLQELV